MRDGGKGTTPRPLGVELEQFDNNWDAIFSKKGVSLNSIAHPVAHSPEPSCELDPDALETIEIDIPGEGE